MVLEKLSGCTAESRIAEPGFADVRYVRAMLRQVLCAVDRAYAELGASLGMLCKGINAATRH